MSSNNERNTEETNIELTPVVQVDDLEQNLSAQQSKERLDDDCSGYLTCAVGTIFGGGLGVGIALFIAWIIHKIFHLNFGMFQD